MSYNDFLCYYTIEKEVRCENAVSQRHGVCEPCKFRLGIEWFRADQHTICGRCGKKYLEHPEITMDGVTVHVLCGGQRVKL